MHVDELDIDADLVRRLLRAKFPQWAGLAVSRVPDAGTDNALYRIGEDMVVRLPRREHNVVGLEKERVWLPRLAPFLPLAVPVPLEIGGPGEGYPLEWAIYRWLEGETATAERLGDLARAAADLAELIAALQRIDPTHGPPPGRHNGFRGAPLALRDRSMRSGLTALSGEIDVPAVTSVWAEALAAPSGTTRPFGSTAISTCETCSSETAGSAQSSASGRSESATLPPT
jgi:aminoglycoside phosphotransferase (APT) family kinase protein